VTPEDRPAGGGRVLKATAIGLGAVLAAQVGSVLATVARGAGVPGFNASTVHVARLLFSPSYLYAFEATSILILAALVGAVALAKKEL
jgi:NADH:ubiquinone oxidoreductase subunit 6 (subunit J)